MNATPSINLNATNAMQSSPSGKSQEASTESAFKQVLSSETNRRSQHATRDTKEARTDAAESTTATAQLADPESAASEAKTDAAASTDTLLALVVPAEALKAQPADSSIGLALSPPFPVLPSESTGEDPAGDQTLSLKLDLENADRKGRGKDSQAGVAGLVSDPSSATAPSGKSRLQAAIQAATAQVASSSSAATTAAAFASQLAAARQADALNTKELPTELLGATPLRTPAQTELPMPSVDPLASNKLTPSVGTTAWSQALGEKVVWMAAGAQQTASLTLNPPNLGPLQIVLNLTNDQASASFFSAQPEVRQALEAAFPKLREMMNEAGIQLGQASVSAESPRQNDTGDRQAERSATPFNVSDDGVSMGQGLPHSVTSHSGRGLIDTFA